MNSLNSLKELFLSAKKNKKKKKTNEVLKNFCSQTEYPINVFPKAVIDYINNQATQLSKPKAFFGTGILGIFAGAIGTKYRIKLSNSHIEPAILWMLNISGSGHMKTACYKSVWNIAEDYENILLKQNEIKIKEFNNKVRKWKINKEDKYPTKPMIRILKLEDCSYEYLIEVLGSSVDGTSFFRDEVLGSILALTQYNNNSGPARAFHLDCYNSISGNVGRKGSGYVHIPFKHLSTFGSGTIKNFKMLLNNEENIDDGFSSRFLVCYPPLQKSYRKDIPTDTYSLNMLKKAFKNICEANVNYKEIDVIDDSINNRIIDPNVIRLNKTAQDTWIRWSKINENVYNEYFLHKEHPFEVFWNKLLGQTARLALVIHIIKYFCGEIENIEEINKDTIDGAIELGRYYLSCMYKLQNNEVEDEYKYNYIQNEDKFNKIQSWIKKNKKPMNIRTMIHNRIFKNKEDAIKNIDEWIRIEIGIYIRENEFICIGK